MTIVRSLAFGGVDSDCWGVAWIPDDSATARVALGAGVATAVLDVRLDHGDGDAWRLVGEQSELVVSPLSELLTVDASADHRVGDAEQLCRVDGRIELDGEQRAIDSLGWRAARATALDDPEPQSFRQVSAWFDAGDALAVLALRPRKARGHETDVVTAALWEPEIAAPLSDPRLSTTYTEDGRPARAGIEMWVGRTAPDHGVNDADHLDEPVDDERDEPVDDERQFPRRAAGEALGSSLHWVVDPFELHAELFRWHSRGLEGTGVYLLGVRR